MGQLTTEGKRRIIEAEQLEAERALITVRIRLAAAVKTNNVDSIAHWTTSEQQQMATVTACDEALKELEETQTQAAEQDSRDVLGELTSVVPCLHGEG